MEEAQLPARKDLSAIESERLGQQIGCFRYQSEFDHFVKEKGGVVVSRWLTERSFKYSGVHGSIAGWSELIGGPTYYSFSIASDSEPVDLRDQLVCAHTGLSARIRFCASLALRLIDDPAVANVYLTEQCTIFYKWLRRQFPRLVGSEFFEASDAPRLQEALGQLGCAADDLRFEDVTGLTWMSNALDALLCLEVLEHVPDHRAALAEFYRTLRPGGYLILTAPFMQDSAHTLVRARITDEGSIEHLVVPEYHGDPVRAEGVLCFQTFGWELLDEIRASGFRDAAMLLPWDYTQGLMGPLWTAVARK